ncbi:hypothetical protein BP5796_05892 [Coleophoma crateriformis]|uniref:FAD/NAD(P)-binding domain-containing protein n=1 Tax=Coleophoma crateriformis TaxID=565419 RepID=A0A3D8RVR7_9HELO|nr:hypothetical protein BP5796_05892 [Coleophoma crateriformis]
MTSIARSQETPLGSLTTIDSNLKQQSSKPTAVIIGTGWAGWELAQSLSTEKYNVIVISPWRTIAITPLLASAACGLFDFRMAEEPVRRRNQTFTKYQASVSRVCLESKKVICCPTINGLSKDQAREFEVDYDKLILCPGSAVNTFGIQGVSENTLQMKTVPDAQVLKEKILDCFETASLPTLKDSERKDILHFAIVGGGPTGVELAAELDDLIQDHLLAIYPHCREHVRISVYDVADRMLGAFGEQLSKYAMQKFRRRGVQVLMEKHITFITPHTLHIKEDGEIKFGICVWAVGNKASSLVEELDVKKSENGMERLVTDQYLRVLKDTNAKMEDGKFGNFKGVWEDVFALGDAADIWGNPLPTTAEVALQKARWLSAHLNTQTSSSSPEAGIETSKAKGFQYKDKALVAYLGNQDGVVGGAESKDRTGASAWVAWKSGNLGWSRGWRRKAMLCVYWMLNAIDGREVARR